MSYKNVLCGEESLEKDYSDGDGPWQDDLATCLLYGTRVASPHTEQCVQPWSQAVQDAMTEIGMRLADDIDAMCTQFQRFDTADDRPFSEDLLVVMWPHLYPSLLAIAKASSSSFTSLNSWCDASDEGSDCDD